MACFSGASPKKPSGTTTKCKDVVIEVYDGASFSLSRNDFENATLALCMSQHGAEVDRNNADTDPTLKFLGGLVTNNEQNKKRKMEKYKTTNPQAP